MQLRFVRAFIGGVVLSLPALALTLCLVLFASVSASLAGMIYTATLIGVCIAAFMIIDAVDHLQFSPNSTPRFFLGIGWLDLGRAFMRAQQTAASDNHQLRNQLADRQSLIDHLPDPVLVLNRQRQVVQTNPAGRQFLGRQKSDAEILTAMNLSAILRHPDVVTALETSFLNSHLTGAPQTAEIFLAPQDRYFLISVQNLPLSPSYGPRVLMSLYETTALKRSDRLRRDFIANASHELRTPLTAIEGFIETLRGPARNDPVAQEKFLSIMAEQAARMSRLIRDLLSLSRIEMEEHDLPQDDIDLRTVLTRLIDGIPLHASQKPPPIDLDLPSALPIIRGDADQLAQLFLNLIDNAQRYAADSPLTITAIMEGSSLSIRLKDQGRGIAPEHLPRLTERFYRIPSSSRSGDGGTGLGLAIVKHIVGRHRGQLAINSVLGKGTEVIVSFPLPES